MNAVRTLVDCDLRRIEAEYLDVPGLKLTAEQASRFWQFDAERSEGLLESLVEAGVLYRARDGSYLLLTGAPCRGREPTGFYRSVTARDLQSRRKERWT